MYHLTVQSYLYWDWSSRICVKFGVENVYVALQDKPLLRIIDFGRALFSQPQLFLLLPLLLNRLGPEIPGQSPSDQMMRLSGVLINIISPNCNVSSLSSPLWTSTPKYTFLNLVRRSLWSFCIYRKRQFKL